jgi:hypothetical protein
MRVEFRGGPGGLAAVAIALAATVGFAFLLGIPEIFGISFGWRWAGIDRGHTAVNAITPKIGEVNSRDIFLSAGEELVARYDFRLDAGRARVSLYTWGWVPAWGPLQTFHQDPDIRANTSKEVRIVAPVSGFYVMKGTFVDATGDFSIDWQVERSKRGGQGVRLLGFLMGYFPLLLVVLLLLALAAAGLLALTKET